MNILLWLLFYNVFFCKGTLLSFYFVFVAASLAPQKTAGRTYEVSVYELSDAKSTKVCFNSFSQLCWTFLLFLGRGGGGRLCSSWSICLRTCLCLFLRLVFDEKTNQEKSFCFRYLGWPSVKRSSMSRPSVWCQSFNFVCVGLDSVVVVLMSVSNWNSFERSSVTRCCMMSLRAKCDTAKREVQKLIFCSCSIWLCGFSPFLTLTHLREVV